MNRVILEWSKGIHAYSSLLIYPDRSKFIKCYSTFVHTGIQVPARLKYLLVLIFLTLTQMLDASDKKLFMPGLESSQS